MINSNILMSSETLRASYIDQKPFPHIILDGFLSNVLLDIALDEIKGYTFWSHDEESQKSKVQINKYFSPSSNQKTLADSLNNIRKEMPLTFKILQYLSSEEAINFISKLTGIENLEADKTWLGGGVHKVTNGGKLAVHADFNKNWITGLYRRVNLLLYLNKDWQNSYGGDLELWSSDLQVCHKKVAPIFNRAIIFTTARDSYHGHPTPMILPEDTARYSIALYYFTKEPPPNDDVDYRFVQWKTQLGVVQR
jgi:Rps23 Pro-64 3,4-dihydroxylase Tpa1-like proline 4-hydroxylase